MESGARALRSGMNGEAKTEEKKSIQTNKWDVILRLGNRCFSSGYALPVIFALTFLGALWIEAQRLTSGDFKELTEDVMHPWLAAFGWLLFLVVSATYILVVRWMRARYEAEIARQREIIERFLPPDRKDEFKLETKP